MRAAADRMLLSSSWVPSSARRRPRADTDTDTLDISPVPAGPGDALLRRNLNLNDTSLRAALDETACGAGAGAGAGQGAGDRLGEAFYEVVAGAGAAHALDALGRLAGACEDALELAEPWSRYDARHCWLAEEAGAWRLLLALHADSLRARPDSPERALAAAEPALSQRELVSALFAVDPELTLLQLLTDWLEASAARQASATDAAGGTVGDGVHWGNTLHDLLVGSSLFDKNRHGAMVTCADPDAPRRQRRTIHSDDRRDDEDLCKRVFKEVRCGRFDEATALCLSAGQTWRSAVLQGWRLLHYSRREAENCKLEISGNPSRDLWKWCCMGIVKDTSENPYYRATVGILCGHLESVLPVCEGSWEDLLWAHLRVQIELRVDRFLREHHATVFANTTPSDVLELLEKEHQPKELSLQQIFGCVNALMNGKQESSYQTCQRFLMLGDIGSIMQESTKWLESTGERFVRFLAHLVLILRQMGKESHNDIGNKILESYIDQLIRGKADGLVECPELIAYYTSTVPSSSQIELYADLMERIVTKESRQRVVKAGISAGIDIGASARLAIKKAINSIQQGYGNIDVTFSQTNEIEKEKSLVNRAIGTLEWMSFVPNQAEEALWLSNAMTRTFIFIGNVDAASQTLNTMNQLFPHIAKQLPATSSALCESLCLKAYLEAVEGFAMWYRHFMSGQPKDVEPLRVDATFTDKVHHEQLCAQVAQQKARWTAAVFHQTKQTKTLLYNVILYPGHWLEDHECTKSPNFTEEEYALRAKQLETLKKLCIPEITLLILKVLQSGTDVESHVEAIKLANLIAAENRKLYNFFTKDKLIEVLHRIKESSLLALENGRDSFGYEINND